LQVTVEVGNAKKVRDKAFLRWQKGEKKIMKNGKKNMKNKKRKRWRGNKASE